MRSGEERHALGEMCNPIGTGVWSPPPPLYLPSSAK